MIFQIHFSIYGSVSRNVDTSGTLSLERQIFFPQLHPFIKDSDPDWYIYRVYLKDIFKDGILPSLIIGNRQFISGKLNTVTIDGYLNFLHHPFINGLQLV